MIDKQFWHDSRKINKLTNNKSYINWKFSINFDYAENHYHTNIRIFSHVAFDHFQWEKKSCNAHQSGLEINLKE